MLNRPAITDDLIIQINSVIAEHPDWNRTKISQHLCELWDWRMPNGLAKHISCRDMLRALDKAGKIILPKAIKRGGYASKKSKYMQHSYTMRRRLKRNYQHYSRYVWN